MNNQLPPKTLKPKGSGKFKSFIQWIALLAALILILMISIIPLGLTEQLIFAMLAMGFTFMVRPENESSRFRLIVLMVVSFGITCRYIYWRITESMGWFDPEITLGFWDHFFSMGLLAAEIYAWTVLFLGFIQSIWPLRRPVLPLPVNKDTWPAVDVYIPTYNEPLNVVIPSILAARDLDWPKDKLNVYVLDDGCRPDFAAFAKKVGVRYIQREDSTGAKAGNINNALRITDGEYIAVFDSDHAPVRSFLKKTMGWFIRDGKLGLLQTPHLFFTPDPVERNLDIFKKVPNEGQLFYGLIQDGNDNWNAAFFCGSCAVLRRGALNEIGGITADTVTEDAHTSLKMHKQGWNSAYLNMP
ncbi:MAG TPA: UDP-forming cellulose synthase catalytic subunit, partial [Gammaproteobacteria bacterium]|nr:UDP-forming cellulose synthase catalytic subunit [Gammaproteobacteria bacterium]